MAKMLQTYTENNTDKTAQQFIIDDAKAGVGRGLYMYIDGGPVTS